MKVSRAKLVYAVDENDWDLLDLLLENDKNFINDNALFTDDWGSWWGMLFECVRQNKPEGVKVLLKHGAKKSVREWGDGFQRSPLELAEEKKNKEIIDLLTGKTKAEYTRKADVTIPDKLLRESEMDAQDELRNKTGLVFNPKVFRKK